MRYPCYYCRIDVENTKAEIDADFQIDPKFHYTDSLMPKRVAATLQMVYFLHETRTFIFSGRVNNKLVLDQILTWPRWGHEPLSDKNVAYHTDSYMRNSAVIN